MLKVQPLDRQHTLGKVWGSLETLDSSSFSHLPKVINHFLHPAKEFATVTQGVSLGFLPYNIFDLGQSCKALISKPVPCKKINAALDIISSLKEIGEAITIFFEYLVGLHALRESATAWAGPFGLVMSALSVASIARKAKICKETNDLLKEFDAIVQTTQVEGQPTPASLSRVISWIENRQKQDKDFLLELFNSTEMPFAQALVERERLIDEKLTSASVEKQKKGGKLLAKTLSTLRGRVQKNITSSAASIVASVVNMIGCILIFVCPVLPIGWGLVGLSALIDGGRFVHHKATEYTFAKQIGMQRTKWEWLLC